MSKKLKISIVTPSFNQGKYIEETILSIINQNYRPVEFIIMDGGSTDETVSIIEKYSDRIDYWTSARDRGQSDALNRGFARATGDILAWVNSDDALSPGALDAVAAAFETGRADIVAGIVNVRQDGLLAYRHRTGLQPGILPSDKIVDLEKEWLTGRFFFQPEVFFSRAVYERAGGIIDESLHYSMDYDLWLRLSEVGARILPIDCDLAEFRLHQEQKTSTTAAYLPELTRHANAARRRRGLPDVAPQTETGGLRSRAPRIGMLNDLGFNYGAGRAHGRMAKCLAAAGSEVIVFSFRQDFDDPNACNFGAAVSALKAADVDAIVVGNIHGVFPEGVDLTSLASVAPVLAVTHDFFQITGRCPYPMGCDLYLSVCPPECPTRDSYPVIPYDEIPAAHARKWAALAHPDVYIVANSAYTESVFKSAIASRMPEASPDKVRRICLPIPEPVFNPDDRAAARAALGLSHDEVMVLSSSVSVSDKRKGFGDLLAACRRVDDPRLRLFAMGSADADSRIEGVTYLGHLDTDEAVARCFRAADVFVSATADETFGQTLVEAALCGCPSIAYAVGAVPEVVIEGVTGWLVRHGDVAGLAGALDGVLAMGPEAREASRSRARLHAASYHRAPSFLSGFHDILRDVIRDPSVRVPTGVQFDGGRSTDIVWLHASGVELREGFDLWEGPYPHFGIRQRLRWQLEPEAHLHLRASGAGLHRLTVKLANTFEPQVITLSRDGIEIARFTLEATDWSVTYVLTLSLDLPAGETPLILVAPVAHESGGRLLRLALLEASLDLVDADDEAPAEPTLGVVHSADGLPLRGVAVQSGFDSWEGPFPALGVAGRLAWQVEPEAHLLLRPAEAGLHRLTLRLANTFETQVVTLSRDGTEIARFTLEDTDWSVTYVLALSLDLLAGETPVILAAPVAHESGGRLLHLALLEASLDFADDEAPAEPALLVTHSADGLPLRGVAVQRGFDSWEGPFPALGVAGRLAWQVEPEAHLRLRAAEAGLHRLTLRLANTFEPQVVTLSRDGTEIAQFDLVAGDWSVAHLISVVIDLPAGSTIVALRAERGTEVGGRLLHLSLFEASLEHVTGAELAASSHVVSHEPVHDQSQLLLPHLALLAGFYPAEGPHPTLGIDRRLAWQADAEARVAVEVPSEAVALAVEVHLPCEQEVQIVVDGQAFPFERLGVDTWDRLTLLLVPLTVPYSGWRMFQLLCSEAALNTGRPLRCAIFDVKVLDSTSLDELRSVSNPRARVVDSLADGVYSQER